MKYCLTCHGPMVFHPFCPGAGQGWDEWRCLMCGRPEDEFLVDPLKQDGHKHCLWCEELIIDHSPNHTKKFCTPHHSRLYHKTNRNT